MLNLRIKILLLVFFTSVLLFSQEKVERIGEVTYRSSQNIYFKFEKTEGITVGDTLFAKVKNNYIPTVEIKYLSSNSCAGNIINNSNLKVGDLLVAFIYPQTVQQMTRSDSSISLIPSEPIQNSTKKTTLIERKSFKKNISNGRISIQSYSNILEGKVSPDNQRWRYNFSYYNDNIAETGLSFSSYFNYSYRVIEWNKIQNSPWDNLKVYDLSFGYNFDDETSIKIGRYLNPKVSNISSVDGIQLQKKFSNYFIGLIAGSRPNFTTLGFDSKLFEFGVYVGRTDTINNIPMENTLSFFQQTNNFKTDRRFLYYQHNSSLIKNFNLFLSSEVDIYSIENGKKSAKPSLTSFFLSTRYSPSRILSFNVSYDARKNVIYYETFKNTIDSIIENETRQGIRFGTNIRPFNNIFIGMNAGYRFLKKDIKPAKNFNGYIGYSQIPFVEVSTTLSYTGLNTSYVNGSIYGIRLSKSFSFIDYTLSASYTKVEYDYLASLTKIRQNNFSLDLSGRIFEQVFLSCSYEGVFEDKLNYSTVLVDLSFRF